MVLSVLKHRKGFSGKNHSRISTFYGFNDVFKKYLLF